MRTLLAEKLLSEIMNWSAEEISEERPLLQALSRFKYDEYRQFSQGTRYIESLAKWLEQFNTLDERKVAYDFIKRRLVYISDEQMTHLVNITFTDKINPILINKTADKLGVNKYYVRKIINSTEYKELLRRSLFIGLSDGSRIDQFRRSKIQISNEQVFPSYYIQVSKAKDMKEELEKDGCSGFFTSLFLFDDFTASGKSFFRKEEGEYRGKVCKLLREIFNPSTDSTGPYSLLFSKDSTLDLNLIFYLATKEALNTIQNAMSDFISQEGFNVNASVSAIQIVDSKIKDEVLNENDFISLMSKESYFDDDICDSHYKKGKHDSPYLGFNECGLPLVLTHNTPNNSLPILWFPEDSTCVGLFPRITRHKDE